MATRIEIMDYQAEFLQSEVYLTGLISGVAVGKTYIGALWTAIMSRKHHPKLGILASGTYPQLRLNVIESLNQNHSKWGFDFRHLVSKRQVEFIWPLSSGQKLKTRAWALGLEEPHNTRGASVPFVYCDEARQISREGFTVLLTRAREGKSPQIKLTSTPNGFDWLYEQFNGEGNPDPSRKLITGVASGANPYLPEIFVPNLKRNLDPTAYAQEVKGQFVQNAEGRVYHQFDRSKHLSEKAEYDPNFPIVLAWDFNVLGSCLLMQNYKEDIWVFDEVQIGRSWTPEVVEEILRRYWEGQFPPNHSYQDKWTVKHRPRTFAIAGDATGMRHSSSSRVSDYDHIRKALRDCPQAKYDWEYRELLRESNPSVRDRINKVNALFLAADGKTRLTIHPRCKYLIRDLEQVAFKPGTGDIDKGRDQKLTHLSDALGYGCYAMFPFPDHYAEGRISQLEYW